MVAEPETIVRTLGQLEGRIAELSASIQETNSRTDAGLQEANRRMDVGLQEVNRRMDAGFQEVNRRMEAGFQEVNRRIDRMLLAMLAIGGGVIITQTGLLATLIIRSG